MKMEIPTIKVSLSGWEKMLLDKTRDNFSQILKDTQISHTLPSSVSHSFGEWAWASQIKRSICDTLDTDEDKLLLHRQNPQRTWDILADKLSTHGLTSGNYRCTSRLHELLQDNLTLESFIKKIELPQIAEDSDYHRRWVIPNEADSDYWILIDQLRDFVTLRATAPVLEARVRVEDLEGDTRNEKLQALFESLRLSHEKSAGSNLDQDDCGTSTDGEEEDGTWILPGIEIHTLAQNFASASRQVQRKKGLDAEDPWRTERTTLVIEPNSFLDCLEYIPVNELHTGSEKVQLSNDLKVSWAPSLQGFMDHHIFTEEEVLRYCVEKSFEFPEYRERESIIFIAKEVTMKYLTKHCKMALYNDCAITMDPDTQQPYLLETLPGQQFRRLASKFNLQAARKYFRSVIDRDYLGRPLKLQNILQRIEGADESLKDYEGIIDAIPCEELDVGDAAETGHSRSVHFAQWRCPAKLGMSSGQVFQVALKKVSADGQSRSEKLLRELNNTLGVFAHKPLSSITLYGITYFPASPNSRQFQEGVFLVFKKGSLLKEYLDQVLLGTPEDWDFISGLFMDLAGSINSIHKRCQVHRDLSIDNVVIQQLPCPQDPYDSTYTELVVIDLGEGQMVGPDNCQSGNEYGNKEYWAPELQYHSAHTYKSDIFAAGCVMTEMIRIRCTKAGSCQVPNLLRDLVRKCLQKSPESRPDASCLESSVEDLRQCLWVCGEPGSRGRPKFDEVQTSDFETVFVESNDKPNMEEYSFEWL